MVAFSIKCSIASCPFSTPMSLSLFCVIITRIFLYRLVGSESLSYCITASGSCCWNTAATISSLTLAEARLETVRTVASGFCKMTSVIWSSVGTESGHTTCPSWIVSSRFWDGCQYLIWSINFSYSMSTILSWLFSLKCLHKVKNIRSSRMLSTWVVFPSMLSMGCCCCSSPASNTIGRIGISFRVRIMCWKMLLDIRYFVYYNNVKCAYSPVNICSFVWHRICKLTVHRVGVYVWVEWFFVTRC